MDNLEQQLRIRLTLVLNQLSEASEEIAASTKGVDLEWWIFHCKGRLISGFPTTSTPPDVNMLLAGDELSFLLQQAAYCAWGIGYLKRCRVFPKPDFIQVLQRWTNPTEREHLLLAVSSDFYRSLLRKDDYLELSYSLEEHGLINELSRLIQANYSLEEAVGLTRQMLLNAKEQALPSEDRTVKLVELACQRIVPFYRVKFSMSWLPVIGNSANVAVNLQLFNELVEQAKSYYSNPIR